MRPAETGHPPQIEVYGEALSLSQVSVRYKDSSIVFCVSGATECDGPFSLGAFFTKSLLSEEAFCYPRSRRIAVLTESPVDPCFKGLTIELLSARFPMVFTHQRQLYSLGQPFVPLLFGTNWLGVRDSRDTERIAAYHPRKSLCCSFLGSIDHDDTAAYGFRRRVFSIRQRARRCRLLRKRDTFCHR